ncbi:hypothetical protein TrVE_jg13049 [Triparma verrucosa]|uniref:Amino acid transporter transmembrane domain-containing protein n=1 Tax=Triparma verrucosa TaxID=1606542 RepID=A0A9W7CLS6_9STRA|nr:hypothetical protein TrVE_jg13049 [Triparma verrucosa]
MAPREVKKYGSMSPPNSKTSAFSASQGTSFGSTVANLSKICVGTGVLALPYSFAQGGVLCSVFGLAVIAVWNSYSISRLLKCEEIIVSMGFQRRGDVGTFSAIAKEAVGNVGLSLVDYTIVIMMVGVCISYQVAAAGFLVNDPTLSFGTAANTVLTAVVLLPISCVPDIGFLSKYSVMGLGAIVISFLVIFYHGYTEYGLSGFGDVPVSTLYPDSLTNLSHWYGVSCFCFGISPMTFNVKDSMSEPSTMNSACRVALLVVFLSYCVIGDGTLLLLTPDGAPGITGDILQSLPAASLMASFVRISMTFVCLVSFPLCMVPAAEVVEGKLFMTGKNSEPTPVHLRVMTRSVLVAVSTTVAALIPSFVLIVSLIGCLCVGLVTFIFPPFFHMMLLKHQREYNRDSKERHSLLDVESHNGEFTDEGAGVIQEEEEERMKKIRLDRVMLVLGVISTIFTTGMTLGSVAESMRT